MESVVPEERFERLRGSVLDCRACSLASTRRNVVFGGGDFSARIMFIGEAPGAEEDRRGEPFVGQAGKLLDGMIRAMKLNRKAVFITNILKCRPPGNRDPRPEEITACSGYLQEQIDLIKPDVIIALGRFAARWLTGTEKSMTALRGRWGNYRGIPLMATYHPAYLLRNPDGKASVWKDLKLILSRLDSLKTSRVPGERP